MNKQPYGRPYKTSYEYGEALCAKTFYDLIANSASFSNAVTGIDKRIVCFKGQFKCI